MKDRPCFRDIPKHMNQSVGASLEARTTKRIGPFKTWIISNESVLSDSASFVKTYSRNILSLDWLACVLDRYTVCMYLCIEGTFYSPGTY